MAGGFDSIGYVRRLEQAGVERRQAEARADAARDFVLDGIATRRDLDEVRGALEHKIETSAQRMTIKVGAVLAVAVGLIVALERIVA